ncbi:MAG: glycosyltransferase family 2 protein [Patescibacteria group bacterium]
MKTNGEKIKLSTIIPVYNEEEIIARVVDGLKNELSKLDLEYEIIAVNDGSSDKSKEILENIRGIKLINHPYNKGYGASLKTGARNAKFDWLLFFDGDGQHKPECTKEFLKCADEHDAIIGWRQGYQGPALRQPGKKLLHLVANYLAERKIPDLNCGFRLLKKKLFHQYEHLFPNGFSLSTTSTLTFFKEGLNVKYVPITINKRCGKSSVKISDGPRTLMLIIRLTMLFSPLKIFLPVSAVGFVISISWAIYDLINSHFQTISKSSGFLFVASLLVFLFGLLADQIAAIRREIKK